VVTPVEVPLVYIELLSQAADFTTVIDQEGADHAQIRAGKYQLVQVHHWTAVFPKLALEQQVRKGAVHR
jgi:hypothetical protein